MCVPLSGINIFTMVDGRGFENGVEKLYQWNGTLKEFKEWLCTEVGNTSVLQLRTESRVCVYVQGDDLVAEVMPPIESR
jgi:hypothetical protein